MSRNSRGFTLLEVMAAVALLGILYTVLARVAIDALRAEGESARRLEASLVADAKLTDSFTAITGGPVVPALGFSETTEGDFKIALDVTPFLPPREWGMDGSQGAAPLLFAAAPGVAGAQALRTVHLTVSWLEGVEERHVSRTMFLVDFARVQELATAAGKSAPSPEGGGLSEEAKALDAELGVPSEQEEP